MTWFPREPLVLDSHSNLGIVAALSADGGIWHLALPTAGTQRLTRPVPTWRTKFHLSIGFDISRLACELFSVKLQAVNQLIMQPASSDGEIRRRYGSW
jgi:hypothetical protein